MADPTYEQLPGELDLTFVKGDEVGFILTLENIDLTGYSFDSRVYTLQAASVGGSVAQQVSAGTTVVAITVTPVALTAGRINLSMTESQTNQLSADGAYRWWLKTIAPGDVTRTVVSGDVSARMP